jgi:predicted ATP-grasp superfamily ATP-dependent carboligase/protein-tyrosine-phosphatase
VALIGSETLRVSSRAIANVAHLQGGVEDSAQLLRMLVQSEGARWVVPTSDSALTVICATYEELSRVCAVGCPPPNIVQRVLDKPVTLEIAARCGVPVPVSVSIASASDLDSALQRLRFPVIAKPGDKGQTATHEFKTRTFRTVAELRAVFREEPRFGEGLIFQTYHGGQGVGIELLMVAGEPVASFQHRRLSENPPSGGVAVVAVAEPVDPMLLEYSVRLLRAIEWDGVAMVEFRHDRDTGQAALMEVNGRFWGSLPLAVAAGVDFPYYAWQASQKLRPVVPASYRSGLRVRWTAGALMRFAHAFSGGAEHLSFGAAAGQLISDFRPGTGSAMWSWSDPMPAVQEVSVVLGRWLKDAVKAVIHAVVPASALSIVKSALILPGDRRAFYLKRRIARAAGLERVVTLPPVVQSIVFVCHGNIMRSASAAQFLREDLEAAGVGKVRVTSAGTHARNGKAADPRVRQAASDMGVNLDEHRATLLTADIVESNDVIFAMDEFNFANIATEFPQSRGKLMLFGGMNASGVYRPHEIADPYVTGQAQVSATIGVVRRYVAELALALAERRDRAIMPWL